MPLAPLTGSNWFPEESLCTDVAELLVVSLTDWKEESPKGKISFDFIPFAISVEEILDDSFSHVKLLKDGTGFWDSQQPLMIIAESHSLIRRHRMESSNSNLLHLLAGMLP